MYYSPFQPDSELSDILPLIWVLYDPRVLNFYILDYPFLVVGFVVKDRKTQADLETAQNVGAGKYDERHEDMIKGSKSH